MRLRKSQLERAAPRALGEALLRTIADQIRMGYAAALSRPGKAQRFELCVLLDDVAHYNPRDFR